MTEISDINFCLDLFFVYDEVLLIWCGLVFVVAKY